MTSAVDIRTGDCLELMRQMPEQSVQTCVTSPPYYGLRDYGVEGQIGLEETPEAFVEKLVEVFREVRRVLRDDGTVWLNLADSYAGSWGAEGRRETDASDGSWNGSRIANHPKRARRRPQGFKNKDRMMIPARVAIALQADGWWLRDEIIWHKRNAMPLSVTDRTTPAHEMIYLLSKRRRYHYDAAAIAEPAAVPEGPGNSKPREIPGQRPGENANIGASLHKIGPRTTRNKRSVWTVLTQPFAEAHFATFPPKLIEPCILAGAPEKCCAACGAPHVRQTERVDHGWDGSRYGKSAVEATGGAKSGGTAKSTLGSSNGKMTGHTITTGFAATCDCDAGTAGGVVLDPFGGAGTTGLVALRLGRRAILLELNPKYADIARERLRGKHGDGVQGEITLGWAAE